METQSRLPARLRSVGAVVGVLVLTMPMALMVPAAGSSPPPAVLVHAVPVRAALTVYDDFDRPSSAAADVAQIVAARSVVRASRDSVRATPVPTLLAVGVPTASAARKPASPAAAKVATSWRERWVRPSNGRFTSGFKQRWGRMHRGIDLAAPTGTRIGAAANGTVIFAGAAGGYGRLVLIRHSGGVVTAYGHMSKITTHVGERVRAGERIALVGSAGRSTGPHLHFEVRVNGVYVNPVPFLAKRKVFI